MQRNSAKNEVTIVYELDNASDFVLTQNLECIESLFQTIESYINKFDATIQLIVVSEEKLGLNTIKFIECFQGKHSEKFQFHVDLFPESTYFEKKFHGIAKSSFENVLLADSDCFYELDWIEQLMCELQIGTQIVWGKTFAYKDDNKLAEIMRYVWYFPISEDDPLNIVMTHRWGNNFGVKKELLNQYPFQGASHFGKNTRGDLTQWVSQMPPNKPLHKIVNALAYHRQIESVTHFTLRMYQAGKDFGCLSFDATIDFPRYFLTLYLIKLAKLPNAQKASFKFLRLAHFKSELSTLNLAKAVLLIYWGAASYYCGIVKSMRSMVESSRSQTASQ